MDDQIVDKIRQAWCQQRDEIRELRDEVKALREEVAALTKKSRGGMKRPSVDDLLVYAREMGWVDSDQHPDLVDVTVFHDYFESVGWVTGTGKPMKDWRAAMRVAKRKGWINASPSAARRQRKGTSKPESYDSWLFRVREVARDWDETERQSRYKSYLDADARRRNGESPKDSVASSEATGERNRTEAKGLF